ncbi:hypothetical protein AAF712_012957 [Marasmius tenuissimus]|uniref:C2H2-type domain-containing protein n=1 Tax=Marasmius tenuissimus TaxID=585030 RepID=A0ABR2ZG90_9AGAR
MPFSPRRKQHNPRTLPCPVRGCTKLFRDPTGLKNHVNSHPEHESSSSDSDRDIIQSDNDEPDPGIDDFFGHFEHAPQAPEPVLPQPPLLPDGQAKKLNRQFHNRLNGRRCDEHGNFLPDGAPPPPPPTQPPTAKDWRPCNGAVPWEAFSVQYDGPREPGREAPWMEKEYMVYYRDPRQVLHRQLGDPDFVGEIETTPYESTGEDGKRQYQNFMSGNWAMREANKISEEHPASEGAMLCATITGSDKTTVSVATGQNDYYPAYLSNGCLTNNARKSHRGGVSLFMFLAIPKTSREHQDSVEFRKFRRHLFHQCLRHVFEALRPYMTAPDLVRFGDGYYRRVIYSLGPYIGDYPEQVLLTCIVQGWCPKCTAPHDDLDGSGAGGPRSHEHTRLVSEAMPSATQQWDEYGIVAGIMPFTYYFPRADIHALIAPDILHQLIKGTFKDHLVTWVQQYLEMEYSKADAAKIMADIDRRIAAAPPFPDLRRFPEGRGFKQWTANDSKALMKVYLAAIVGRVPDGVVRTIAAFIEFCYLVRRDVITEDTIYKIGAALETFHRERVIFEDLDVIDTFSLPRQHSLCHYPIVIPEFESPNGLCTSITESKHISAVKEPWRRSSRNQPLSEMLVINERMDKLQWAEADFRTRGMLDGPVGEGLDELFAQQAQIYATERLATLRILAVNPDDDDDDGGPVDGKEILEGRVRLARKHITNLPRHPHNLGPYLGINNLPFFVRCFLYEQNTPPDQRADIDWVAVEASDMLPELDECTKAWVYPSASATFSAPSDLCGFGGLKRERIRSVSSWKGGPPRRDCVFVNQDPDAPGFRGLYVARVLHFLALLHDRQRYECAIVSGFTAPHDHPDPLTGMWIVQPDADKDDSMRQIDIIPLESIVRGAHLLGVAGEEWMPNDHSHTDSLDDFQSFYVNKYIDHHAHEIAF